MDLPLDQPAAYAAVGVGLPELVHAEVGGWPHPRVGVEARFGWVVFNPMVGIGVDGAVWSQTGGPRGHAVTVTVEGMVNPSLGEVRLASGGDVLGAYAAVHGGWRWVADSGLLVRARVGVLLYDDGGFAAGPDLTVGLGWAL